MEVATYQAENELGSQCQTLVRRLLPPLRFCQILRRESKRGSQCQTPTKGVRPALAVRLLFKYSSSSFSIALLVVPSYFKAKYRRHSSLCRAATLASASYTDHLSIPCLHILNSKLFILHKIQGQMTFR